MLVRYEVALWNAVDQALRRDGRLTLGQLHALRVIDRYAGQARVQDLSSDIGISVGAASKLVDRLERDGLAVRRPNPANRRSSLIAFTPRGHQALTAALERALAAVDRAVAGEDVQPLVAALGRLQARLDDRSVGTAA
ncbi:MarR family winged helix-turn-helix transcriptional regulator [Microlunatus aurantiacus]|uniref:MarR family winged helix-turn-helix transcriptional regulator n=1 Tax=Microlunatus aurantiacus TaxID=446786 RepID=UPI0031D53DCC